MVSSVLVYRFNLESVKVQYRVSLGLLTVTNKTFLIPDSVKGQYRVSA